MNIYIPSTSRSDLRNTNALRAAAEKMGHRVVRMMSGDPRKVDVAIILGDRHEMLSVAHDLIVEHIPYVHVGAGCVTRGSWDQKFRNMLTAEADAAWAYTDTAAESKRHFNRDGWALNSVDGYGVPILDTLKPRGLKRQDYVLVAINPVTAQHVGEEIQLVDEIAEACRILKLDVAWSWPNEDPGVSELGRKLADTWGHEKSLALRKVSFHDALEECRCIVGNSSAALIEAPVLGTPHIDCGCRQEGRPLAMGVRGEMIAFYLGAKNQHISGPSPYQHPQRQACRSIIELCEEVASAD